MMAPLPLPEEPLHMNAARRPDAPDRQTLSELLSSLADGECHRAAVDEACQQWRADEELRRKWHIYQLIGDVLRSDEMTGVAGHDSAFVHQLRARLAAEPVPLAPSPLVVRHKPRRWMASAAVVAGFVVVGAAVLVLRPADSVPSGWDNRMAQTPPPSASVMRAVGSAVAAASGQTLVIDGQVIRDARLDAYFEAHRGALGAAPSALPRGALRSVEILVPQR